MLIAVLASLAAGASFAVAGVLQQRVASSRPGGESLSGGLLLDLARHRLWLAGIGLALVSYGFQALALIHGPLSLVQPLIVSELVFSIPLSSRLHHLRLGRREWIGAILVAVGLALALTAAAPGNGDPRSSGGGWLVTVAIVAAITGFALLAARSRGDTGRATLYALAGGTVMGTQAALFDATLHRFSDGLAAVFTSWQTYLLIVASIGGMVLVQSAFQAGPLAASAPLLDATEPGTAIVIGVFLFHEDIRVSAVRTPLMVLGLLLLVVGILRIDRSPLIKQLHERERGERAATESAQRR